MRDTLHLFAAEPDRQGHDASGQAIRLHYHDRALAPPRLGQILLERRWILAEDLRDALRIQHAPGRAREQLGAILVRLGRLSLERLGAALREQARLAALAALLTVSLAVGALPAAASDGGLGSSSTASARITLIVPERPVAASVLPNEPARESLSLCLTGDQARAFRRYYGDPAAAADPTEAAIRPADCSGDPGPGPAGQTLQVLLVLEPE